MIKDFLPINKEDMEKRGWDELDFVVITGDAYVDHPTFGTAIISRVIEARASGLEFWLSRTGKPIPISNVSAARNMPL